MVELTYADTLLAYAAFGDRRMMHWFRRRSTDLKKFMLGSQLRIRTGLQMAMQQSASAVVADRDRFRCG